MKERTILLTLMLASGCSPQTDPHVAKSIGELADRQAALEARLAKLETVPPSGDGWVLWKQPEDLHNALNSPWPTAESAYATKQTCMEFAASWGLAGGKQVGNDPVTIENKQWRLTLRCLPKGVDPLPKR